ncbi:MAG: flagellar basal body-associated FliL family protein [Lachnospiraceae bacterium]|nr:flagellar basal body-associated FliL family protein [Lachnospiraceae bacterium]
MKKNIISVVILALLIVNIAISALTLASVMGTNKKTAALVTDIAAAIKLDLGEDAIEEAVSVPMEDVVTYDVVDMLIPLKKGVNAEGVAEEKDHYVQMSLTLSMNSKDKDYKAYGDLTTRESLIKGEIHDVVAGYTIDEVKDREIMHSIEKQILERIQTLFDSKFIYKVTVTGSLPQ